MVNIVGLAWGVLVWYDPHNCIYVFVCMNVYINSTDINIFKKTNMCLLATILNLSNRDKLCKM